MRRKVYCAECWEKMEVKRAASVVRCADCGDRFPLSKTAPFPVRRTLGSSAGGEDIVDVCFLCAPGWEPRRAEEAARRGLANDPARWNAEDAAADAAAAELRAMPRADRLRLLHATLGGRMTRTGSKKKKMKKDDGDDEDDEDDEDEDGAEAALDRRLRDGPDLYPWQVGHPAQAKMREHRSSDAGYIDAPPATIGAAAVEESRARRTSRGPSPEPTSSPAAPRARGHECSRLIASTLQQSPRDVRARRRRPTSPTLPNGRCGGPSRSTSRWRRDPPRLNSTRRLATRSCDR